MARISNLTCADSLADAHMCDAYTAIHVVRARWLWAHSKATFHTTPCLAASASGQPLPTLAHKACSAIAMAVAKQWPHSCTCIKRSYLLVPHLGALTSKRGTTNCTPTRTAAQSQPSNTTLITSVSALQPNQRPPNVKPGCWRVCGSGLGAPRPVSPSLQPLEHGITPW
jgi:hypothetical protein